MSAAPFDVNSDSELTLTPLSLHTPAMAGRRRLASRTKTTSEIINEGIRTCAFMAALPHGYQDVQISHLVNLVSDPKRERVPC